MKEIALNLFCSFQQFLSFQHQFRHRNIYEITVAADGSGDYSTNSEKPIDACKSFPDKTYLQYIPGMVVYSTER